MSHQLSSDLDHRVQDYLAKGEFQSVDEVLHSALDALDEQQKEKLRRWNEGNQTAMEQSRQGLSKPLDDHAVLNRLRTRLAKEGITD
jgi:Arc/MetJ-type ribon-helix-helix transcriptional regulator